MDMARTSPFCPCAGQRSICQLKPSTSFFSGTSTLPMRKTFPYFASVATPVAQAYDVELENKKNQLLSSVQETQRGLLTTADQGSSIEEALVNVEAYNMGGPIDLTKLDGT